MKTIIAITASFVTVAAGCVIYYVLKNRNKEEA